MFKKLSLYLLALLFSTVTANNQIPNREIIALLDTRHSEHIDQTLNESTDYNFAQTAKPLGIGAITSTLLIALYQQAAPIIANKSLIKNVIDHQNIFSDFINLERSALYKKYGHYNKFKGNLALDNFKIICQYMSKSVARINGALQQLITNENEDDIYQALNIVVTDKRFNLQFAPSNIKKISKNRSAIGALTLEMITYLLCSTIDFHKDWQIKQVNDDIFLLVPNNYIQHLNLTHIASNLPATPHAYTNLELGLKVDRMKNVSTSFFEQSIQQNNKQIPFTQSLEQIFITNNDIKKSFSTQQAKHIWSVYISGHGLPKDQQANLLSQIHILKNIAQKKLNNPRFKDCLQYEKNKQNSNHFNQCKHHASCQKHIATIKNLNQEIRRIESLAQTTNGIIASLSIEEFRDVLKFLNDKIETEFLYYTSCFAGGTHLIKPYTEIIDGISKPLLLKYSIISNTTSENRAIHELSVIHLPPYAKTGVSTPYEPSELHIQDIDIPHKTLKLATSLNFNRFFETLRRGGHNNNETLLLVSYSLHPHIDHCGKIIHQRIANIPLIRLANTDHFQPIPNDNSSVIVNDKNSSKPTVINKNVALIYSKYIPGKLIINTSIEFQEPPRLISMIPGFAMHTFEEISSSTLNLQEIVNSFLTFSDLASSKIFWIKKLECKNNDPQNKVTKGTQATILKDVIITRNMFNKDISAQCPLETCAYYSTLANKEEKLTWNGPLIATDNYTIKSCNETEHKEECLNFFPHAASYLNPVLQNV